MWTLRRLYLEFITWYLKSYEGIEEFVSLRFAERNSQ